MQISTDFRSMKNWVVFVSIHFLGQNSSKKQKLGEHWKLDEKCFMIGTKIFQIDPETAEIIGFEVGTNFFSA